MQQCWFFILFLFFCLPEHGLGQDERYYRYILTGELSRFHDEQKEFDRSQFKVRGASYKVDLNGDGVEETLEPQNRDGVNWLEIRDYSKRKVFEAKLVPNGGESSLYKIKLVQISPNVRALILFLDEGFTQGLKFEATARIYVVSFEKNDLGTMKMSEGPSFFHEKEAQREQYWRRDYNVNIFDIDGDGTREISVMYNRIQRIMKYRGQGEWDRI